MSIALLFRYGTVVVLSPFATALTRRFGKKEASVVALKFSSIVFIDVLFTYYKCMGILVPTIYCDIGNRIIQFDGVGFHYRCN